MRRHSRVITLKKNQVNRCCGIPLLLSSLKQFKIQPCLIGYSGKRIEDLLSMVCLIIFMLVSALCHMTHRVTLHSPQHTWQCITSFNGKNASLSYICYRCGQEQCCTSAVVADNYSCSVWLYQSPCLKCWVGDCFSSL